RLRQLRNQKGSRNVGKVSLPPQSSGISWVARPRALLRSRVWASLGIYHHRMLAALECEHADHGGKRNGALVFTYTDGEKAGIPRRYFKKTMKHLVDIGLAMVQHHGGYAGGALRDPNLYKLTYMPEMLEQLTGPPLYLYASNDWIDIELESLDGMRDLKAKRPSPNLKRPPKKFTNQVSKTYPKVARGGEGKP